MKRPTGVTIIAVLQWIGGALSILGGILLLGVGAVGWGIIGLVLGIVSIVLGVGMWQLKPWAWLGTLIVQGLNLLQVVYNIISGASIGSNIVSLVVIGVIAFYLFRPDVKAAFGK